jgi:hypothetical protein
MRKVVFLLISKLDGLPSLFVPRNTAENREMPAKSYVFATQRSQVREAGEWESTQADVMGKQS